MKPDEVTDIIIGSAMRVHSKLGPGLLESAYQTCLLHQLTRAGLRVESQRSVPIEYEGVRLETGYRIDLLVENLVIVEVKAREEVLQIHRAQLLSYLRLSGIQVGLLINFHVLHLKHGIARLVNNFQGDPFRPSTRSGLITGQSEGTG